MNSHVLLLDESCDLRRFLSARSRGYYAVVCLFWASPQIKQQLSGATGGMCYSLTDLTDNISVLEEEANTQMREICQNGPKYLGLAWRYHLSEMLFQKFLSLRVVGRVIYFLSNLRHKLNVSQLKVDFVLSLENVKSLNEVLCTIGKPGSILLQSYSDQSKVSTRQVSRLPFLERWWRHLCGVRITGQWEAQIWNLIEKLDNRYALRSHYWKSSKSIPELSNGVTFFSSYLNNSRIIRAFESSVPLPVNWVVSNFYARQGASPTGRPIHWLWQFGNGNKRISRVEDNIDMLAEDSSSQGIISSVVRPLVSEDSLNWNKGYLPSLVNLTRCWENYLQQAKPRLVVVASQLGPEGWFSKIAKSHGIPVLQVMHGVLGGYFYTQTPILSDAFVVYGNFWRNLWPEKERHKIIVFNPDGLITRIKKDPASSRKRITLFSWPLAKVKYHNFSEFTDAFIHTFHRLLCNRNYEVLVRAHPLENPSDFVKRWEYFYGSLPPGLHMGKFEPLDEALAHTDVAVMFRSTVMLNCLTSRIPVIMPGWVDFGWNQAIRDIPGIYLANDFPDLERQLVEWLDRPPELNKDVSEFFVRSPGVGRDAFCSLVDDLIAGRKLGKKRVP